MASLSLASEKVNIISMMKQNYTAYDMFRVNCFSLGSFFNALSYHGTHSQGELSSRETTAIQFGVYIYNWIGCDEQCAESFEGLYLLHRLFTIKFISYVDTKFIQLGQ